jgi:hypothetical protein
MVPNVLLATRGFPAGHAAAAETTTFVHDVEQLFASLLSVMVPTKEVLLSAQTLTE